MANNKTDYIIKDLEERKDNIEKMTDSEAFIFFGTKVNRADFLWGMQHAITCIKIEINE